MYLVSFNFGKPGLKFTSIIFNSTVNLHYNNKLLPFILKKVIKVIYIFCIYKWNKTTSNSDIKKQKAIKSKVKKVDKTLVVDQVCENLELEHRLLYFLMFWWRIYVCENMISNRTSLIVIILKLTILGLLSNTYNLSKNLKKAKNYVIM